MSLEGPEWSLRTMKHYTPEYFDPSKKIIRMKPQGKVDILGKPIQEKQNTLTKDVFKSTPGFKGLREVTTFSL